MTVPPSPQSLVAVVESKAMQDKSKPANSLVTWWSAQWRAFLGELISTMLLIFFGCMTCVPLDGFPVMPPMYSPLGFGFTVMINIQIFGHISGAHMNPAVTLASVIFGGTTIARGVFYCIIQCIGACLGYGMLVAVAPLDIAQDGICVTMPHSGINSLQALGIEFVLTATLSFINCALWDPVHATKQDSMPVKFGLTIAGLSLAGGPLTGASMNPARSLGPALWSGVWTIHWVYWVGPFVGSACAAVFYKYIWLKIVKTVDP